MVAGLVREVRRSVEAFAAGAAQADDVTLLAVPYQGPGATDQRLPPVRG
jgi:hypothetical protein